MTTFELEIKKAQLAREILNQQSEEIINKLSNLYKGMTAKHPCQHTDEAILKSCEKAIEAYEKGELIPHEQIKKKHL